MLPSQSFSEHAEVLQHLSPLQGPGGYVHDRARTAAAPGKGKGSTIRTAKGRHHKEKGKPHQALPWPDDCEIFVDGKQLCKRWQIGRCTAKVKPGKRCMVGYHMCWKKACHKLHRAMNAHTDFSSTQSTTVSLWMPRHLKFAVAQLACQTH